MFKYTHTITSSRYTSEQSVCIGQNIYYKLKNLKGLYEIVNGMELMSEEAQCGHYSVCTGCKNEKLSCVQCTSDPSLWQCGDPAPPPTPIPPPIPTPPPTPMTCEKALSSETACNTAKCSNTLFSSTGPSGDTYTCMWKNNYCCCSNKLDDGGKCPTPAPTPPSSTLLGTWTIGLLDHAVCLVRPCPPSPKLIYTPNSPINTLGLGIFGDIARWADNYTLDEASSKCTVYTDWHMINTCGQLYIPFLKNYSNVTNIYLTIGGDGTTGGMSGDGYDKTNGSIKWIDSLIQNISSMPEGQQWLQKIKGIMYDIEITGWLTQSNSEINPFVSKIRNYYQSKPTTKHWEHIILIEAFAPDCQTSTSSKCYADITTNNRIYKKYLDAGFTAIAPMLYGGNTSYDAGYDFSGIINTVNGIQQAEGWKNSQILFTFQIDSIWGKGSIQTDDITKAKHATLVNKLYDYIKTNNYKGLIGWPATTTLSRNTTVFSNLN